MDPIIIIGTGLAGYSTARELRKHDTETPLVLVSRDDGGYYYKPDLSEALTHEKTSDELVKKSAEEMAAELNATIHAHRQVESIDPATREVRLNGDTLRYSKLVLAHGAEPIRLSLAGDGLDAVYQVNNRSDYTAFRQALDTVDSVAVLGAGLIGCEFSNDLAAHGFKVSCIDPVEWPLQRFLPESCGEAVRRGLADAGVDWHLGRTVDAVHHENEGLRLELDDGDTLYVDAVLSAVGLRPALDMAEAAGLAVDLGITVDRHLQTSDEHIYALGDCAEVDGHFRPFIAPLMQAARALGKTLAGEPTAVKYPALPIIVKTPACPTIVYPPQAQGGEWTVEGDAPNLEARYLDANGDMTGFALTGQATKQRGKYIKAAPPIMA